MAHPSQYFTQADVDRETKLIQTFLRERRQRLEKIDADRKLTEPKFPVPTYADADEASNAYANFMLVPDDEQKLRDANELLNDLFAKEDLQLWVLSENPTADEKRQLLGYEAKDTPSLPGIADSYHHVPGNLDKVREQIAALQKEIPLLKMKAARYAALKKSFEPWPIYRIRKERSERLRRQDIAAGRFVR